MNTMTTGSPAAADARAGRRRGRALAVLGATAATLAVWVVAVPLAGVELLADTGGTEQRVSPVAVVVSTLLVSLAGWGLLALLERFTGRARAIWTAVAVAVLLASLQGPLTAAVGTAATVTLVAMHLVAAAVLIPLLVRSTSC
jgi:hypothetical protein